MKPFPMLVGVVSLCAAIGVISWMGQPPLVEVPIVNESGQARANPFPIAEAGPYPKAVLEDEDVFNFGIMILGETDSHTFVIRNDGDAPLKLHKGYVACKCTIPNIPEGEIPPGESAEVVMQWKPLGPTEAFDKMANIWTNDPENETITLTITGEVRQLLNIRPPLPWSINGVKETGETEFKGIVVSGKEAFNILEIESSHDWLTADVLPMTADELQQAGPGTGSGYVLQGKIRPEMTVGRFEGKLTLHTDLGDDHTLEVTVDGTRPGPFSILGKNWHGAQMAVSMGIVKSADGKSVTLSMFTDREDEPIVIESVESDPDIAQVSLQRDESFTSPAKEKYKLTFILPPNSTRGLYKNDDRISLRIKTNRKSMAEVNLSIDATIE